MAPTLCALEDSRVEPGRNPSGLQDAIRYAILAPAKTIAVGDVLDGKYEITGVLGRGAMGVVYEALHKRLQRKVALKTLRSDIFEHPELVARFEREARAASAIGHANIVQVFDAGEDPMPYLAMERLYGESLGERLERVGTLETGEAIKLVLQGLEGISAAHRGAIVHRDLKPDNLFITSDDNGKEVVKIMDFGVSKILDSSDGRRTQAGLVMGTPFYMSPEQAAGLKDIDHRADLWSLACVLYECISGKTPFLGTNSLQTIALVLGGEFEPLSDVCPDVPTALSSLLNRALDPDVDKRFSSAEEFAEELDALKLEPAKASLESMGLAQPMGLSGFDNLADRFLAQEAEDEAQAELPEATSSSVAVAGSGNRFAPPDVSSPVPLALGVDPHRPRVPIEESPLAAPRKPRAQSQWVTREEPSHLWSSLFKVVLLLALAAGGVAGYRYYSLGYVLPKEAAAAASLKVELIPKDTIFILDNAKQESVSVSLKGGKEFSVALQADGYLLMRARATPEPGQRFEPVVHMAHTMPTLPEGVPGTPAGASIAIPALSSAQIAVGYEKLAALVECGSRLTSALQSTLPASDDEEPTHVPYNLIDECRLVVETNAAKEPAIEPLDSASTSLVASMVALNSALRDQQMSSASSSKIQRSARAAVRKASIKATKERTQWFVAMNTAQSRWLQDDAARIRAREGVGLHSLLRDLIGASDSLARARLSGAASIKALHEAFVKAHASASEDARNRAELYRMSGGALLLRSLAPLLDAKLDTDVLHLHNQAVGLFNELVLPIALDNSAKVRP